MVSCNNGFNRNYLVDPHHKIHTETIPATRRLDARSSRHRSLPLNAYKCARAYNCYALSNSQRGIVAESGVGVPVIRCAVEDGADCVATKSSKLATNSWLRDYVQERLSGSVHHPDATMIDGPSAATWRGRNMPRRHQDRNGRRRGTLSKSPTASKLSSPTMRTCCTSVTKRFTNRGRRPKPSTSSPDTTASMAQHGYVSMNESTHG